MKNILSLESGLMRGMSWIADMVILNVVTVLCSLPIITIGAAITALYDAVSRMQRQEGNLVKAYFQAFRSNFKNATALWCILLIVGVGLFFCLNYHILGNVQNGTLLAMSLVGLMLWGMLASWVFIMQAKFENTVSRTLYNSFVLCLAKLPKSVLMTMLNSLPWLMLFWPSAFLLGLPVWFLIWFSLTSHWNLKLLRKTMEQIGRKND